MKKLALMLIASLALFNSCKIETTKDLGPETTETKEVDTFSVLSVSGSSDVVFIPSDTFSVTVTAPQKAHDRLVATVENGEMRISEKNPDTKDVKWVVRNTGTPASKIVVRAPYLTGIRINGSGSVRCDGAMNTQSLWMWIMGSGEISMAHIAAQSVDATITGSGDIEATLAQVGKTCAEVTGSGEISMKLRNCGAVNATITGSGDIELSGTAQTLKQTTQGSGDISTNELKLTK